MVEGAALPNIPEVISRKFGRLIFNRCSDVSSGGQLNFETVDFSHFYDASLVFLRCRRLISLFTAVTINCAFVSPSTRLLSNSATMSCGKRALSCCDLLLVEPVAITESPSVWCDSVYAKKMTLKGLKCDSLGGSFKGKGAIHLVSAKPGGAPTPNRASDHKPLVGVTVMADQQHTQTHPKFTWLFLGTPKGHICSPIVLRTVADTEENARAAFFGWNLTFAAKIRTEGPYSLTWTDSENDTLWSLMGAEIDISSRLVVPEVRHA